jgi:hypothetical protein
MLAGPGEEQAGAEKRGLSPFSPFSPVFTKNWLLPES